VTCITIIEVAETDLPSRSQEASRLIQRKGQLADHDQNCEREKIEAVIHCRSPPT
jgi:hypothetical protein